MSNPQTRIALLTLALLFSFNAAHASEVTGTLSSSGAVTSGSSGQSSDGSLTGDVVEGQPANTSSGGGGGTSNGSTSRTPSGQVLGASIENPDSGSTVRGPVVAQGTTRGTEAHTNVVAPDSQVAQATEGALAVGQQPYVPQPAAVAAASMLLPWWLWLLVLLAIIATGYYMVRKTNKHR